MNRKPLINSQELEVVMSLGDGELGSNQILERLTVPDGIEQNKITVDRLSVILRGLKASGYVNSRRIGRQPLFWNLTFHGQDLLKNTKRKFA